MMLLPIADIKTARFPRRCTFHARFNALKTLRRKRKRRLLLPAGKIEIAKARDEGRGESGGVSRAVCNSANFIAANDRTNERTNERTGVALAWYLRRRCRWFSFRSATCAVHTRLVYIRSCMSFRCGPAESAFKRTNAAGVIGSARFTVATFARDETNFSLGE